MVKSEWYSVSPKQKSPERGLFIDDLAEAVRFELTDPFEPPVFKTGAIDHSATLPAGEIVTLF
jgi:hypothetical protein